MGEAEDMGAYEIDLAEPLDMAKFSNDVAAARGRLWLIKGYDGEKDFVRFRGVMFIDGKREPTVRLMLDVGVGYVYVNAPMNQKYSKLEIARAVREELGGVKMYKDGVEVV